MAFGQDELCELYPIALCIDSLENAEPEDVIPDVLSGSQSGNFGWLTWAGSPSTPTLTDSLTPPGDSSSYVNPDFPTDHIPSIGDWVQGKPGVSNSKKVRNALDLLKTRDIKVPVWDQVRGQGANTDYRIFSFASIRILDYQLPGQSRISARFLGFVTCGDQNFAPIVNAGGDQAIVLPDPITLVGSASDDGLPAGAPVTVEWSLVSGPAAVDFGNPNALITSAIFTDAGEYKIRLTASDSELTANDEIIITVNHPNSPPEAEGKVMTTMEDTAIDFQLHGSDPDDDALTFSIITQPSFGSLSGIPPNLQYVPIADYHGSDAFTFTVNDGLLDSEPATIQLKITPVNDPPTADPQSISTVEDTTSPVDIILSGADIDGDGLAFIVVDGPSSGVLDGIAPNLTYTPNPDFNGTDRFTFIANDGAINSENAVVEITVAPVNDMPVANNQSVSTSEDTAVDITLAASDVDGDTLTFSIITQPINGSLTGTAPDLTYTPNTHFYGSDRFTFTASDGELAASDATVTITIHPVNDPPVADSQSLVAPEDMSIDLVLTGSDVDGDSLIFTIETPPVNGTVSGEAPNLIYTPNTNFHGGDSFTIVANDGAENSASAAIDITVESVNDPPTANSRSLVTDEDVAVDVLLTATDVEGDTLTYSIITPPANGSVNGDPPTITYTPDLNFNGNDTFTFMAGDGTDNSVPATVSININSLNDPPVANGQHITTLEDNAVEIILSAVDVDGDGLSFMILDSPIHGSLSGTPPQMIYTPGANYHGVDSFTFKVNDGSVNSAPATVSIDVEPVNDAPMANNKTVATPEDTEVAITLTGIDVDKDPLIFSIATPPLNGILDGEPPNITYIPNAEFNGLDRFTFFVNDGSVNSPGATITITVNPVNDPPTVDGQSLGTLEDTPLAITLTGSDIDSANISFSVVTHPSKGSLSGTTPNLVYTPRADVHGNDSFSIIANDGALNSVPASIDIVIDPVNDAPLANDLVVAGPEDTSITGVVTGSDVDGDIIAFSLANSPANGMLSGTLPDFTYNPNPDFNGSDHFSFITHDGILDSDPATVTINVNSTNDPPQTQDQTFSTDEDVPLDFTLTASDIDGDTLAFTIVASPAKGTITGIGPEFTYTPNPNFNGIDTFSFKVNDGFVDSAEAVVAITVTSVNDAPVANNQSISTLEDTDVNIDLAGSDIDGDALSFTVISQPTNGTLNGTLPNITYTPNADFHGSDAFNFVANDGTADSPPAIVSIVVIPVNDVPTGIDQTMSTQEDTDLEITLAGNDKDGDPITFTIDTLPEHGSITGTPPIITYAPSPDFNGEDRFTFVVNDGAADSVTSATITITIDPVNDAPVVDAQSASGLEDTPISITLTGADIDEDSLSFTITEPPINGSLSGTPPDVTYTPNPDLYGNDRFIFVANDSTIDSAPATVSINVQPVNDTPVAQSQSLNNPEDTVLNLLLTGSDVDNDSLTFKVLTSPISGTLAGIAPNLSYTPNTNVNGTDSFTFVVNDGSEDSPIATVTIAVDPVNDRPVGTTQNIGTAEDTDVTITLSGTDVENDPLTFAIADPPTNGIVSGTPPELTYTPNANFNGVDHFAFITNDGTEDSLPATVTINVSAVNDAPTGNDQSIETAEDTAVALTLTGADIDGDEVTFEISSQPANGTLTGVAPTLTYTPNPNFNGTDNIPFLVNDGTTDSSAATVTITVTPVNDAPEAIDLAVTTNEDIVDFSIVLPATDLEEDTLSFTIMTPPEFGALRNSRSPSSTELTGIPAEVFYTPNPDFNGTDSFTFITSDGALNSEAGTVNIAIQPVNDAPIALDQSLHVPEDSPVALTLTATDVDGDPLTFSIVTQPQNGVINGTPPNLAYTPSANFYGMDTIVFKVNDGELDSQGATVTITLDSVNDPPKITSTPITSATIGQSYSYDVEAADPDAGDVLTFSLESAPSGMTIDETTGFIYWTPQSIHLGVNTIKIRVTDVDGLFATQEFIISIVDTAPPVITITTPENNSRTKNLTMTVAGTVSDASLKELKINNEFMEVSNGNFSKTINLNAEGSNTITITAKDLAGNIAVANLTVVRDTAGPELTISSPADGITVKTLTIEIRGYTDDTAESISLNGVSAVISGGEFMADIPLQEGSNLVGVSAVDDLGNTTATQLTVTRDTTAPDITISDPTGNTRTRDLTITVTGTTEPGSTLAVNRQPSPADFSKTVPDSGLFALSVPLVPNTTNTITLTATDAAGNPSPVTTVTVSHDDVAPILIITSPATGTPIGSAFTTKDAAVTISGTVDDPTATVTLTGSTVLSGKSVSRPLTTLTVTPDTSGNFNVNVDLLPDARHDLQIIAVDHVGNSGTASIIVIRDTTPPEITILSPVDGAQTPQTHVDVIGSIDDNAATVAVNGQTTLVAEGRFTLNNLALSDGTNTISAIATDTAGNPSPVAAISIVVDTIPPEVPLLDNLPSIINTNQLTLSGTSEPNAQLNITGGLVPVSTTADQTGAFQADVLLNDNTSTVLSVKAVDSLGNASDPLEHTVVSDTIPPQLSITSPRQETAADGTTDVPITIILSPFTVAGSVGDANTITSVTVNQQPVTLNPDNTFSTEIALTNGRHTLEVVATDAAGNKTTQHLEVDVQDDGQDGDPPVISIVSPVYDAVVPSATIDIIATIIDQSSIASIAIDGTPLSPLSDVFVDNVLTIQVNVDANGEFTLETTDNNGLTSNVTHRVVVDSDIPESPVVLLVTPGAITNQTTVTIRGTAEPSSTIQIKNNVEGSSAEDAITNENGVFVLTVPLVLNTTNTINLTATDAAGNESPVTTITITHENIPPEISISGVTNNQIANQDVTPVITTTDNNVGGGLPAAIILLNKHPHTSGTTISSEGTYTLSVTAEDEAGNTASTSITFTIDKTPPAITISGVTNDQVTNTNITPVISVSDPPFVGSVPFVASLNDAPFTSDTTISIEGNHSLMVTSTDAANNSASQILNFTIDKTPPVITISGVTDGQNSNDPLTPTITISDPNVGGVLPAAIILLNNQPFTSGSTISAPGSYLLEITSTDHANNTSTQTISFTIGAPLPAPILDSLPTLTNQTTITLTGFAEPGSQLAVSRQPSTANITQLVPSTGLFSIQVDLTPDTINTLSVTATNASGTSSPAATVSITQDSTPPTVVTTNPTDGGTLAISRSIFIEFSEPVDSTNPMWEAPPGGDQSGLFPPIRLFNNLNQPVPGKLNVSASGKSATFFPGNQLLPDSDYGILIDTAITDRAGNHLPQTITINFRTLQISGVQRPAAPVLDPFPPSSTLENAIALTGHLSVPGTDSALLHVLGGQQPVQTPIAVDGSFEISVPLILDERNTLVVYVTLDGIESDIVIAEVLQTTRPPGIRILTPQEGLEYHNQSITVMGVIDSPEFVDINSIRVDGEVPGIFGRYFARQVIFDTPGEKTITATASVPGIVSDSGVPGTDTAMVNFSCNPQPDGIDTQAPIVKIVFPEPGYVAGSPFVEVMGTVEEGVALASVTSNNVHAHSMLGNIFLVYAELTEQGENTITVLARDKQGLLGQNAVTVFLDDTAPVTPVVAETPALTDKRIFRFTGTGEPGEIIIIRGGLTTVRTIVNADGTYVIDVPLSPNTTNNLEVLAIDSSGNQSPVTEVIITHDDTAPRIVTTFPPNGTAGVAVNERITVTFSEPMNPSTINVGADVPFGDSFQISSASGQTITGNIIISADNTQITFIPAAKFLRDDIITVELSETIADMNGFSLGAPYTFSFHTALYKTTLSGVIVDPNLNPIEGIRVGIIDSSILDFRSEILDFDNVGGSSAEETIKTTTTSSFGAFLLDDVPPGPHILYVDGTSTNQNLGDSASLRVNNLPYLEFEVNIIEDTDNSLGRPVFLVPADLSTLTSVGDDVPASDNSINFVSSSTDCQPPTTNCLDGFSITYEPDAIRFADGTSNGTITATRIQPAHIPDRLPDGSIPHFLVHLSSIDNSQFTINNGGGSSAEETILSSQPPTSNINFSPPASLTFPNVYELAAGEKVKVFHFQYGIHNYTGLGEATVASDGSITTGPILFESGFIGIIPSDPDFDLAKNVLRGRVVDVNDNGIPGIPVNAIAGGTTAVTDANGEYTITLPDIRLFVIQTYASIPTNVGATTSSQFDEQSSQTLVYQSELTELQPSGITEMPDIVVNTFFLGGNIRFIDTKGDKVPRTGLAYDQGNLVSLDDTVPRGVNIHIYTQVPGIGLQSTVNRQPATSNWNLVPYASTSATLNPLDLGFDASFSIPIVTSVPGTETPEENNVGGVSRRRSSTPTPGDLIKIIAFSPDTGYYGETDLVIPSAFDQSTISHLKSKIDIDLRPPLLDVTMNRVFFIDGIRRRAGVPHEGIVFTSDEFVEIKTKWTTPDAVPLNRPEIELEGRLMIDSINYQNDTFFTIHGGEHARILEIREALYPQRLQVLQKETDVGTETFTFSPDGSFDPDTNLPANVGGDVPADDSSQSAISNLKSKILFYVIDLEINQQSDGSFLAEGRAEPGLNITFGNTTATVGPDGRFSASLATIPEGGLAIKVGDTIATLVGASFAPVLDSLNPAQGSQGGTITITGENFSPITEENNVKFNGAPAQVTSATETELSVIVPNDASAGPVTVTVAGKTSNGLFFDFVSEGIPNGSFETGTLNGFSTTGNAEIITSLRAIVPTDREFMAFLNTLDNPKDGRATITTDRFIVPSGVNLLAFDFSFTGTLIFKDFSEYIALSIISGDAERFDSTAVPQGLQRLHFTNVTGYNQGLTFRTGLVDISEFSGQETPIRVRITLFGRGDIPPLINGLRVDDDNPLDITKIQGTGLLLDNLRLAGSSSLPTSLNIQAITLSRPNNENTTIAAETGGVMANATIYALGLHNGRAKTVQANSDGSFAITVPTNAEIPTYYALYYSTPKTLTDNTSNRFFSPSVLIRIETP